MKVKKKLNVSFHLFALRCWAFLALLILFLLLLSDETQRQTERFWKDVWLPGVLREKREVDKLLLVNAEDKNSKIKMVGWQFGV